MAQHIEVPPALGADEERSPLTMERRMRILDALNSRGTISVAELTELLGASPATVRRDLMWLDEQRMLTRTRGGAIMAGRIQQFMSHYDPTYQRRLSEYIKEKKAIGRAAADLVSDGETIIVDAGSTTQYMIPFLANKRELIIITNSLAIVNELLPFANGAITVMLIGGTLRTRSLSFVGLLAEQTMTQLFVDKTFLGVRGISVDRGFTNPVLDEIPIKRQMINAAKHVVVLADHTKFERTYTGLIAPLNAAHTIITDVGTSEALIQQIGTKGPQVLIAQPNDAD